MVVSGSAAISYRCKPAPTMKEAPASTKLSTGPVRIGVESAETAYPAGQAGQSSSSRYGRHRSAKLQLLGAERNSGAMSASA